MRYIDKFHEDFGEDKDPNMSYPFKECPGNFDYEPDTYVCDEMPDCKTCWMREMPEVGNDGE